MFPYKDPTETGLLEREGALEAYRSRIHKRYEIAAKAPGTHFKTLEEFEQISSGDTAERATIPWEAFPIKQAGMTEAQIDRDRFTLQEEYVEWSLAPATNSGDRNEPPTLTFSTEFPDYYEALADVSFDALATGVRDIVVGANPTPQELLGLASPPPPLVPDGKVGSLTWAMLNQVTGSEDLRAEQPFLLRGDRGRPVERLQRRLQQLNLLTAVDGDFGGLTEGAVIKAQTLYSGGGRFVRDQLTNNPWTNGDRDICCLIQRFNTLPFLFQLVSLCCVPTSGNARAMCDRVSPDCVPGRNSDPIVCTTAQRLVQENRFITLQDPARIRIVQMKGRWRLNGSAININDPSQNQGIWTVSRGGQRGVLKLVPGLELDSSRIRTGSQVARKLIVGVDVLVTAGATPDSRAFNINAY